jgi:hypothetical protein
MPMEAIVKDKFDTYPDHIQKIMKQIRNAILDVAKEDGIGEVEETLKWGEPSYLVKGGSTVRIDWKPKFPNQYAIYFHCKTLLVETFREIYGELFKYEGNRAIVLQTSERIPITELKHCISLSFRYHKIKNIPLLGA